METEGKVKVEDDDVVILGDFVPKPMRPRIKKRKKRHVELGNSKSDDGSLIITQKVKVKKRKHKCILNVDTNVNKKHCARDSINKNSKYVKDSCNEGKCLKMKKDSSGFERIAPVCLRQSCIHVRCQIESNIRKGIGKKKIKLRHGFPRDLKRFLSPISPNSTGNEIFKSVDSSAEISLDASSFGDVKESKLDTLIKRTRERDRKNEVARTRYLSTPPHEDTPLSKEIIEVKETCIDYKPPCTSTPKYEENMEDKKSISITNTDTKETKIKDCTFFKEIQAAISPIKSFGNTSVVVNPKNEQNIDILPDNNCKKESNLDNYSKGVNNEQEISMTSINNGDNMSISDCGNSVEQPNQGHNSFSKNTHIDQHYSEYVLSNTNLAQTFDKINISLSNKNVITNQFSKDIPKQNKYDEYPNNTLSKTSLVQNFDKINLSNNKDITKQLNFDHKSFYNELMQNNKSEFIHTSFSNKNSVGNGEENGKSIMHKHSSDANIQQKYAEYSPNIVSNENLVQNHDKTNLYFFQNEDITKQLSLVHNSLSNELVQNIPECMHTSYSNKNNAQNLEENGNSSIINDNSSILYNNYGLCQNLNQISVTKDPHIQQKHAEYPPNSVSNKNLNQSHDKTNLYYFQNKDITKQQIPDYNLFSKELVQNNKSDYIHTFFSSKECNQNVVENGNILNNNYDFCQNLNLIPVSLDIHVLNKNSEYTHNAVSSTNPEQKHDKINNSHNRIITKNQSSLDHNSFSNEPIQNKSEYTHTSISNSNYKQNLNENFKFNVENNYGFSQNLNQDNVLFSEKFMQQNQTTRISNKNSDEIIGNEGKYNPQNQEYVPFPDEQHERPKFFNKNHNQNIEDEDNYVGHSDYSFSDYPNKDRSSFSEEYKNSAYLHEERLIVSHNNNRFTKQDDTPFLDEPRYSKSEYVNTEHKMKSPYHNNTRYRHSSRDQSPFFDERKHKNYEYTYREYQTIEDNRLFQSHSNIDKFKKQFYGDEQFEQISDKYEHKRNVNYEHNPEDRISHFRENNNNNEERSNRNRTYDDNIKHKRSEFIYTDNTYRDCDREYEDRSMSLSYENTFSKQQIRNPSPFSEETEHNRYDYNHTDVVYEQNIKNRNMSTSYNNKKFRDKIRRNSSPFIEDIKSEYFMKSPRNRYTSRNNFTTRSKKDHSPFEDKRTKYKQQQMKNNIHFVQDKRMPTTYNSSNNNKNKHNPENKFTQPRQWDHRSIFEEIHLQYKKSNHTVYSNPKYEHNSKRNDNKPYTSHNRNLPNHHKTSKYVHTVSSRKYKKVVHQRETWDGK